MIKVLPSSNPCDEGKLVEYVRDLMDLGVEYLHCDVMDGVFVANKCLDITKLREIRNNTNILLDVHLMVDNPLKVIDQYISLKPNIITVHYESCKSLRELKKLSRLIRSKDILFGVALKPNTPVSALFDLKNDLDMILIMSVEPGKSGQKFLESSIQKIKDAVVMAGEDIIIEVDGGINEDNFKEITRAGGTFLVMGNAFFKSNEKSELLHLIDKHYKK